MKIAVVIPCPRWVLLRRWNSQYAVCSYWTISRIMGAADVSSVAKFLEDAPGSCVIVEKVPKLDVVFLIFWTGVHLRVCCTVDMMCLRRYCCRGRWDDGESTRIDWLK